MKNPRSRPGDTGMTSLPGGERVPKHDPRICALGDLDELQCCLGLAGSFLPGGSRGRRVKASLARIQGELFLLGAWLADSRGKRSNPEDFRRFTGLLEEDLEAHARALPPGRGPKGFVLPGGAPATAFLHLARAVCRRAERSVAALQSPSGPQGWRPPRKRTAKALAPWPPAYLNRLSGYLFSAAYLMEAFSRSSRT